MILRLLFELSPLISRFTVKKLYYGMCLLLFFVAKIFIRPVHSQHTHTHTHTQTHTLHAHIYICIYLYLYATYTHTHTRYCTLQNERERLTTVLTVSLDPFISTHTHTQIYID